MALSPVERMRENLRKKAQLAKERQEQQELQKQKEYAGIPLANTEPEQAPVSEQEQEQKPEEELTFKEKLQRIKLNEKQQLAVDLAKDGKAFCLIGAAGTGKTTASIKVIETICNQLNIDIESQNPAEKKVAIVAYTRRAARNSAKNLDSIGAGKFCMTAHRFLEYQPVYYEYLDENGKPKKTMQFEPRRTASNPIRDCKLIIIEESSMLGVDLYEELREAAPNALIIFIGDLNQLPPVFGHAILGYKLAELPVVELTEVYRQAMESPIIHFQWTYTLKGYMPGDSILEKYTNAATPESGLEFVPFKKKFPYPELYARAVEHYMLRKLDAGEYDPEQDTILIPFNKSFGSILINEKLAEELGKRRNAEVWEIMSGFQKKYFAVGDFVMYEKAECNIVDIKPNPAYSGQAVHDPSPNMTRNGFFRDENGRIKSLSLDVDKEAMQAGKNMEKLLESLGQKGEDEEEKGLKHQASALITVEDVETRTRTTLRTAGEISALDFGYCMTIHKSQGSEWRKVWLIIHKDHSNMLYRELLYTGMTRAKDKLTVLYSPQSQIGRKDSTVAKAISKARIPGKTWQDKVEYFKGKVQ